MDKVWGGIRVVRLGQVQARFNILSIGFNIFSIVCNIISISRPGFGLGWISAGFQVGSGLAGASWGWARMGSGLV